MLLFFFGPDLFLRSSRPALLECPRDWSGLWGRDPASLRQRSFFASPTLSDSPVRVLRIPTLMGSHGSLHVMPRAQASISGLLKNKTPISNRNVSLRSCRKGQAERSIGLHSFGTKLYLRIRHLSMDSYGEIHLHVRHVFSA